MTKTVLLAEDEPNIVESLSFLLERVGFEICVATDGRQALDMALAKQPDVLVLDLMLPEIDGYEVLRQLRADPVGKKLPVLQDQIHRNAFCLRRNQCSPPYDQDIAELHIGM